MTLNKFISLISTAVICITSYGQQKTSVDTMEVNLSEIGKGNLTYRYYTDTDGNRIRHGALSMKDSFEKFYYDDWYKSIFSLSADYHEGKLNGAVSMKLSSIHVAFTPFKENYKKCSFAGEFNNGIPDGRFNISYDKNNGERKVSLTATYKEGILTGDYSFNGDYPYGFEDTESHSISGKFTADGKMTGKWKIDGRTEEFLNGIRIDNPADDATLKSLSRQYASGKITAAELESKGIAIYTQTTLLGEYAWNTILYDGYIPWNEIQGIEDRYYPVTYEYLDNYSNISDDGIMYLGCYFLPVAGSIEEIDARIKKDENRNISYITIVNEGSEQLRDYCKGIDWSKHAAGEEIKLYMNNEQSDRLRELMVGKYERTLAENIIIRLEETIDNHADTAKTILSEMGCPDTLAKNYMPLREITLAQVMRTEATDSTDAYMVLIADIKLNNTPEFGYSEYEWQIFLNNTDYTIIPGKTFASETLSHIPNDYDIINEIMASIRSNNDKIEATAENASFDVYSSYRQTISELTALDEAQACDEIISRLEKVLNAQSCCGPWMEKCVIIHSNDQKIINEVLLYPDINNEYSIFKNSNMIVWTLENDHSLLDKTLTIQEKVMGYIQKRKQIDANNETLQTMFKHNKDASKGYSSMLKSIDITCPSDFSEQQLDNFLDIQGSTIQFIEKRNTIQTNDLIIETQLPGHKDLIKAYEEHVGSISTKWTKDIDITGLDAIISAQNSLFEAANLIETVEKNDEAIKELGKDSKQSKKLLKEYKDYMKDADLSWTPETGNAGIMEVIEKQESYIRRF